jgi:hypothetical protein
MASHIRAVTTQQAPTGWVKTNPNPLIWISTTEFVTIRNNSNYYHIAKIDLFGTVSFFTSGNFDVLSIVAFDSFSGSMYVHF